MSLFNLDRFRFRTDKAADYVYAMRTSIDMQDQPSGSTSPSSDKENTPAQRKILDSKRAPGKGHGHVLEDDLVTNGDPVVGRVKLPLQTMMEAEVDQLNEEMEDKLAKLQEVFPQRTRIELLEVIKSTGTLDGAVAFCLVQFGDKDSPRQRKKDGYREQDHDVVQPSKRRKADLSDDSDEEGAEPSWEKQEALVRRLQRKLPDQDKEVLRDVLQEHEWDYENALGSLRMFSESDSRPSASKKKKSKHSSEVKSRSGGRDLEDDGEGSSKHNRTPSLSRWLSIVPSHSSSQAEKTQNLSSETSKPDSHIRTAKATSTKRKRPAETTSEQDSSTEDEEPDSEVEGLSDDFDSDEEDVNSDIKAQILKFLQEASVDELTLISGCSMKKAQKIISLRPFSVWQDLKEMFYKGNGLSLQLVQGCRVVLKEREVVLQLMGKCGKIARKMTTDVTRVIEKGMGSMKQPSILNSSLKLQPYQLIGLKWLILLHQHKLSGILADEMGLGKTIQAIAFLAHLHQRGVAGPHLITVPASTLDNWVRELGLWCPSLKVLVYYGSAEDRRYLRYDILKQQVEFDVIISTYNLTIGNENDRSLFRKLRMKYALFDEGHLLKNMTSLRYRHLMAINAEHRLLLTGTPMQNNLLELMSLLNFIMPSMFSSSTSQIGRMFSTKSSEEESSFHKDRIAQAKLIMKPFILRRVKSEVLKQLPPKEEKVEMCPMSDRQQQLYVTLSKKLKRSANGEKKELCNVMMQLRKMANHPLLHRQYYTTEKLAAMSRAMLKEPTHFDADPALIQEDMEVMSDFELHNLCQQYSAVQSYQLEKKLLLDSGKFALLTELLAPLKDQGDRVVLFSQFTMVLDIVEVLLKHLSHRYIRLDGSTPMGDRIGLIDRYNTDPEIFVFLLSTRAGGQGINLASANVVILHDIDCNPFNDKQAEDRCHRLGQTRTVRVIKLVSKDSIEDCMLRVGHEKLKLEQCMTTDEGVEGAVAEDMAELLKVSLGL